MNTPLQSNGDAYHISAIVTSPSLLTSDQSQPQAAANNDVSKTNAANIESTSIPSANIEVPARSHSYGGVLPSISVETIMNPLTPSRPELPHSELSYPDLAQLLSLPTAQAWLRNNAPVLQTSTPAAQLTALAQALAVSPTFALPTLPAPSMTRPALAARHGRIYRVATYERVSRPTEVTGSHSFDTQLDAITRRLDQHYGVGNYELVNFSDNGVSGGFGALPTRGQRRTRRSFAQMWERIAAGEFDAVAAYDLSRLYRSGRLHHQFVDDILLPSNTDLLLATQALDIRTPEGRLTASLFAIVDENQRQSTSYRLQAAMATRRSLRLPTGPPPYGWRRSSVPLVGSRRGYEPDPDARAIVLQIRERYLQGANIVTIAGELNASGVPAPAPTRGRRAQTATGVQPLELWNAGAVLNVLKHPCHAGLMYTGPNRSGELIEAAHFNQRFYEPEEYETLQRRIQRHHRTRRTNAARPNSMHLLNGLVRCRRCDRALNVAHGVRHQETGDYAYRYYRCQTGNAQGRRSCGDVTAQATALENLLAREIERLCADPQFRSMLREEAEALLTQQQRCARAEIETLERRIATLQSHRNSLSKALAGCEISYDEFREVRDIQDEDKRGLDAELVRLQALAQTQQDLSDKLLQFEAACDRFSQHWPHLPNDERRGIIEQLVESLHVDKAGRDVTVYIRYTLGETREVQMSAQSMRQMSNRPTGVNALTPRQLAYLHHYRQGRRNAEIAEEMGISLACTYRCATTIKQRLEEDDLEVAAERASRRIDALLDSLPLGQSQHHRHLAALAENRPLLTPVLLEVLRPLSQGFRPSEVARELGITIQAVITRRKRILNILSVNNIPDAATIAQEAGLM